MVQALKLITNEHHAMAAVLICLESLLDEVEKGRLAPEFEAFEAIVDYFQEFPDRFHHPKEDEYLFPAVLRRKPELANRIKALQGEHHDAPRRTAELRWALAEYRENPDTGFERFRDVAAEFIKYQRHHIGAEEQDILPAARALLTKSDLAAIEKAFGENDDPILGARPTAHFAKLFARIVNLAPEPHGVATRRPPAPPSKPEERETALQAWQSSLTKHYHWC